MSKQNNKLWDDKLRKYAIRRNEEELNEFVADIKTMYP